MLAYSRESSDSRLNCHPDAGRWALTPAVALHPGAVQVGVAKKSATQYTVCLQQAKVLFFRHVHLEQELWEGNCALFLGACAEGHEAAPSAAEQKETWQAGLYRHFSGVDFLNKRGCSPTEGSKGSPPSPTTRIRFSTSCHRTILHICGTVSWSVLNNPRSKQNKRQQWARSPCARTCLS